MLKKITPFELTFEILHTALIEKKTLNLNSGAIFEGILLKFGWCVEGIVFYEPLENN